MRVRIIYIFVVALAMCISCTENGVAIGDDEKKFSNVPMRFSVGNLVELQTRGTDAGLQNGTLASGATVGVFVMSECDYDSLRVGIDQRSATYYYDNVECRLDADGTLHPVNLREMFYPIGQDMRIAVFAYAPYDKNMTRNALLMPRDSIGVSVDQSSESRILINDIILGTPVVGNPLRMPVSDYTSQLLDTKGISLNLRHQRSRIILNLVFRNAEKNVEGLAWNRLDTVFVYAENVPLSAPLGCSLDSSMEDYATADSILLDTLLMAKYTNVYIESEQEKQFTSTGIVLPCSFPVRPSFYIVMVSGNNRRYIRYSTVSPVIFERGTSTTFRTVLDFEEYGRNE